MALREILAKFGFDVDTKKLDDAGKKTDALANGVKAVAGAFLAGKVVSIVRDWVSGLEEQAETLRHLSTQMGASLEDTQRWTAAADLAGVSAEGLASGVKFLQKNMADAAQGGGDAAAEFKKLGVEVKNADGSLKPTTETLASAGLAIAAMKNPAERTAATLKIFGRQGLALAPLFSQGADGLKQFLSRIDDLGGGLGEDAIEALHKQEIATKEYNLAMTSLQSKLVVQILPTFSNVLGFVTRMAVAFASATKGTNAFKAAAIVLGTVAISWAVATYAAYLPLIAGIALLILFVDDLITAFKGGDSVIGSLIDKLFGKGTAESIFGAMRKDLDDLSKKFDEIDKKGGSTGDKIGEVFSEVGENIVKFFADDIPEAIGFMSKDAAAGAAILFQNFKDGLNELGENFKTGATQIASDLITGLVTGVENGFTAVVNAFSKLGKAGLDAIRSVFKTGSPSKVLYKLARYDLAEDALGAGLEDGQPRVEQAMQGMFSVPSAGGVGGGPINVYQTNNNDITVHGSQDIADDVRDGTAQANNDNRNELQAALVTTG